jgi:superfamily II DNA or RNA helicase
VGCPEAARPAHCIGSGGPQIVEQLGGQLDNHATEKHAAAQEFSLRPYQHEAIREIAGAYESGARCVLFQLATGAGKTEIFTSDIGAAAAAGERVLILVHRVELIEQVDRALWRRGVAHGIIAPGFCETRHAVQIASVQAFVRRLERWRGKFDLVVVDEAHHSVASTWARALESQPGARVLGVTATPERGDGRGLAEQFDHLITGPSTAELIAAGFLSGFTVFSPARDPDLSGARIRAGDFAIEDIRAAMGGVVIGAAVTEYKRLCPGVPAVAFCVDVAHSQAVAERFRDAGVRAVHIDGGTPPAERRAAIAALGNGGLDVVTNCGLVSEGVDVPAIGAAILLRPTQSLALYLQQVGRALRPSPGKNRALILDFAGNASRHGLPDAPRAWTLDARPRRLREKADAPSLRRCSACGALNRPKVMECVECGGDLRTARERAEIAMKLQEERRREAAEKLRRFPRWKQIAWAGADERRLGLVAEINGWKAGWVYHQRQRALEQVRGAA